jgi:hypothetical protein
MVEDVREIVFAKGNIGFLEVEQRIVLKGILNEL